MLSEMCLESTWACVGSWPLTYSQHLSLLLDACTSSSLEWEVAPNAMLFLAEVSTFVGFGALLLCRNWPESHHFHRVLKNQSSWCVADPICNHHLSCVRAIHTFASASYVLEPWQKNWSFAKYMWFQLNLWLLSHAEGHSLPSKSPIADLALQLETLTCARECITFNVSKQVVW